MISIEHYMTAEDGFDGFRVGDVKDRLCSSDNAASYVKPRQVKSSRKEFVLHLTSSLIGKEDDCCCCFASSNPITDVLSYSDTGYSDTV